MKKMKVIAMILAFTIITSTIFNCVLIGSVNAETITINKSVTGTNGSVEFTITNLELEDSASYEWAIEKTKGAEIENWYSVLAPDYENNQINFTVSSSNVNQLAVLKSVDNAYLTIRKVGAEENLINEYQVNLSLPLSKAITITGPVSRFSKKGFDINTTVYGISVPSVQYLWEKITDSNIINNYVDQGHDISGLNLKGKDDFPSSSNTTWKNATNNMTDPDVIQPSEDGLYYLWLKGENTNVKTVYGMTVVEIGEVKKVTDNSNNNNNQDNSENNTETTGKFADFSKAKIEMNGFARNFYDLTIDNVLNVNEKHSFTYTVVESTKTPQSSDFAKYMVYDSEKNNFTISNIEKYLELENKQYLYVKESYYDTQSQKTLSKIVLNGVEIEKVQPKKYADAYNSASMVVCDRTQLLYNMPFAMETKRKINIKIGKITDTQILKNIKSGNGNGFADLLNYAKTSNNAIYNENLETTGTGEYIINNGLLNIDDLEDEEYYYIYTVFDGENGKYIANDCVTFAQADVFKDQNSYYLFLYGSNDFKWAEFGTDYENLGDTTTATTNLPQTGQSFAIVAIIGIVSLMGLIGFKYIRKNRDIK